MLTGIDTLRANNALVRRPIADVLNDGRLDGVYFFEIRDGQISCAWGLEDTPSRLNQLGVHE